MSSIELLIRKAGSGVPLSDSEALALADAPLHAELLQTANALRDRGFGNTVTYSRKVFIPLTELCRDVCHYCTFAKTPRRIDSPFMAVEQVVELARQGAAMGCKEALFTLGEKPELRYTAAREALAAMGFATTLDYVAHVAECVLKETGLLPHINAGTMNADEIAKLRTVSASMGIMLESTTERLCQKGMPHYGSPDKVPAVRMDTLRLAGAARVPFTSGILIGIGETRRERIESLLALREIHAQYGHLQEIIVQNFRAKPNTKMAQAPEPDLPELLWTLAITRLIFGSAMSIQVPPNLSPGVLEQLVAAGINDWGGVSPLTPDHVNPEAPWPHLDELARATRNAGKHLDERLTIYPAYTRDTDRWLDTQLHAPVLKLRDGEGFARSDFWGAGEDAAPPHNLLAAIHDDAAGLLPPLRSRGGAERSEAEGSALRKADPSVAARHLPYSIGEIDIARKIRTLVDKATRGERLVENEIAALFSARGNDFAFICRSADRLRKNVSGDTVRYVVNRNINYTNICYFKCNFCAFSKGKTHDDLRGKPYDISDTEIQRRVIEAWERGATEVCMQGGIHPDYTGQKYLDVIRLVKQAEPRMHVHAFSPLEVWQGAQTLGISLREFLIQLKSAGLGTLPGTAAEILDDDVRRVLCPDKINTAQWLEVMRTAHEVGFKTTATIMYGHLDNYSSWAKHLLAIRDLQHATGGFTEFVPLPFVAAEAPLYRRGQARRGPTFREAVLMHAVARLVLHPLIPNIQTSWVKMGPAGVAACLAAGANDLGGTLMNESITRAAGAQHGQELPPERMDALIRDAGRTPQQRTTTYQAVDSMQCERSYDAAPLAAIVNTELPRQRKASSRIATVEV